MSRRSSSWLANGAAHGVLVLVWCLHWLPMGAQDALGRGLGRLLWWIGGSRKRTALRNLELCFPDRSADEREAIARTHFGWLGRSILERGMLWYASAERLRRLIRIEGDIGFAERHPGAVMWLVPHFLALELAGTASQLFQKRWVASIYTEQSNPVFDRVMRVGRLRFKQGELFSRHGERALPLVRAVKRGAAFVNLPDMDFGLKDAAFVPFFGVPAATLLAPARMARSLNMVVQPVVAEMLPGGQGWRVRFLPPWTDFPGDDDLAATRRINAWIEQEILRNPAQYLWVHRRFKTRPDGEASVYR